MFVKDRRTDVNIPYSNKIIEFQHSIITSNEVKERQNDYELYDKEIIWVVDGTTNVKILKLWLLVI